IPSRNAHLHLADPGFDNAVKRMLAQGAKVRVSSQPFEIPVAQEQSAFERGSGEVQIAIERVAAGEVVKYQWVARFQPRELLVYLEAAVEAAALGIMIAQNLQ